jgi:hypothetical protein
MVHSPGRKLQRPRRSLFAELSLNSLVDVLVVLVLFSLLHFQASSELA